MRLKILHTGHSKFQKVLLSLIRQMMGGFVPGPIMLQSYRADFFGKPFNDCVEEALRHTTFWNKTEVELMAAFVSKNNQCQFCMDSHTAVAKQGSDPDIIHAVLSNWRTAPINPKLRATLKFLEKLTHTPQEVSKEDIQPMLQAGITKQGIEEAIRICFIFCTINRLADAFDFQLPFEHQRQRMGFMLFNFGYGIAALPG